MPYDLLLFRFGVHFHEGVFGDVADFLGRRYFLDGRFGVFLCLLPPIPCLLESTLFAIPVELNRYDFEEHSPDVEPGE
jgi:hypothetical protein